VYFEGVFVDVLVGGFGEFYEGEYFGDVVCCDFVVCVYLL